MDIIKYVQYEIYCELETPVPDGFSTNFCEDLYQTEYPMQPMTMRRAIKCARKAGWKITNGRATCPSCLKYLKETT